MAFALVHFYKEDTWDVIPYSDIILEDKNVEENTIVGSRRLVTWRDSKTRGKGKEMKVPAEIWKFQVSTLKHL